MSDKTKLRNIKEIKELLAFLESERNKSISIRGYTDGGRRMLHYIKVLKWVLGDEKINFKEFLVKLNEIDGIF